MITFRQPLQVIAFLFDKKRGRLVSSRHGDPCGLIVHALILEPHRIRCVRRVDSLNVIAENQMATRKEFRQEKGGNSSCPITLKVWASLNLHNYRSLSNYATHH